MPKPALHTLRWSVHNKTYILLTPDQQPLEMVTGREEPWLAWLATHSSFSFQGQAGHLNVLKEERKRGAGYWYAYHSEKGKRSKRYLGQRDRLTLAFLEQVAKEFSDLPAPSAFAQTHPGQQNQPSVTLLASKLSPPRLPLILVQRSRLLDELEAIVNHPLTLVSASAGSGKTTLLSAWVDAASSRWKQGSHSAGEKICAWLSLEELDNTPIRFWASIIAALRTRLPAIGEAALSMLSAQEALPLPTILTSLLHEIELEDVGREIILILDDYHVISDQALQEALCFFLDHLTANLHLVLISRTDPDLPLSRLRMRHQLLEIRDQELSFTQPEAASFLTQSMGLALSEEEVAILHRRTVGWIAGLQLAALSLSRQQNTASAVEDFGGSHRYLLDYVQQDILVRLPGVLQDFLLKTSVVTRMNAALCQAITASSTLQESQQTLEEVERANLFVVPLDARRQWYRYHDLFREALQARLQASLPDLVPLLHQRAARWYEAQGELREAITHALAAANASYAASLMEQAAPAFWLRGETRTVHTWVLSLPDAVLRTHTRLALSASLRFIDSLNLSNAALHITMAAQAEHIFTRMERLLSEKQRWALSQTEESFIRRRLFMLRAWVELRAISKRGDIERLQQLSQELDALPEDEEATWEIIPLSFAYWLALPHPRASTTLILRLREAIQRIMEARDYQMAIRPKTMLAVALVLHAQLHQAQQQCLEGVTLLQQIDGRVPWEGHLYYSLFSVSYACNRLEEASHWLLRMLQAAQDWQQVELLVRGQIYSARIALAKGDLPLARQARQKLETLIERDGFALHTPWISAVRVQVWLAEGNLTEASAWAARTTFSEGNWNLLRRCELLMLVRVLLAQQQNVLAAQTLERFYPYFERPASLQTEVEWMALSVVALHRCGRREQAIQEATRLLVITEPEGYVRLDLDTGEPLMKEVLTIWLEAHPEEISQAGTLALSRSSVLQMLATLEQDTAPRPTQESGSSALSQGTTQHMLLEPLSRQEQQVLQLLMTGQTYAEMAQTLTVSINTIKTQVNSIYRKLGVSRRAKAIAVAARMHLV